MVSFGHRALAEWKRKYKQSCIFSFEATAVDAAPPQLAGRHRSSVPDQTYPYSTYSLENFYPREIMKNKHWKSRQSFNNEINVYIETVYFIYRLLKRPLILKLLLKKKMLLTWIENYSLKFHAIDFRYAIGRHRHALLNCVMICFPNHCMQFTSLLWGLSWFEKEICPVLFFKTIESVCHCGSKYLQQLVLLWKQHWSTDFWSSSQSATITRKWKTTAPFFSSTRFFF